MLPDFYNSPMPTTADVYATRDAGAAILDQVLPNWFQIIDYSDLDMNDCDNCVLGKIEPALVDEGEIVEPSHDFASPYEVVAITLSNNADDINSWAYRHGFDATSQTRYEMLRIAWIELINERRNSGGQCNR